jgi:Mrp family chromosome partitioning ATPase
MSEMESCTHDCGSCSETCDEREQTAADFLEKPGQFSSIKKVFAVVSGKGGVGKSLVTSLLASALNKKGYHTAVLDADITGPSIPKIFGVKEKALGSAMGILPAKTKGGIEVMSVNLLLENDTDPVVWRGPIIAGTVKQFWTEVVWNDIDYMLVDLPPGTGDVPLTVFQSIPVDGIIIVASPQELVSLIVSKAVKMANMMNIPIIGLVENMSYFKCPDCGKETKIFGESHIQEIADTFSLPVLARIPISPEVSAACDLGTLETIDASWLDGTVSELEKVPPKERE